MNCLENIEKYAFENKIPIILKESSIFLTKIIKERKPKNILEVGTAIGYSGCLMLLNSEESRLTTIEKNAEIAKIAKHNFQICNLMKRVLILQGDANEIIKNLKNKFDFIFLDGPKAQYLHQLPFLLNVLSKQGVIVADNVLFKGYVYPKNITFQNKKYKTIVKNLRLFIENIKNNPKIKSEILEIGDGIMLIEKNV